MSIWNKLFGRTKKSPESTPAPPTESQSPQPEPPYPGVSYQNKEVNNGNTYEVYRASNRDVALNFLRQLEVKRERLYIICETPEGNLGKDMIMIFDEGTSERIEYGVREPLPQAERSLTHCSFCAYPALPASEGSTRFSGSHGSDAADISDHELLKEKGLALVCPACRAAVCAFCTDEKHLTECPLCQGKMELLSDTITFSSATESESDNSEICPKCGCPVEKLIPVTDCDSDETRLLCSGCAGAASDAVGEVFDL